jgi:hypothetical protein
VGKGKRKLHSTLSCALDATSWLGWPFLNIETHHRGNRPLIISDHDGVGVDETRDERPSYHRRLLEAYPGKDLLESVQQRCGMRASLLGVLPSTTSSIFHRPEQHRTALDICLECLTACIVL